MRTGRPKKLLAHRLLSKIRPDLQTGCWVWQGAPNPKGYGVLWVNRRNQMAHRVVYEFYKGMIPSGMQLDHLCRNRICANPWHLDPVTSQVNLLRGETIAALRAGQTACIWGHPFDVENTYPCAVRGHTYRACRRCKTVKARIYNARKKGVELTHEEADSWK